MNNYAILIIITIFFGFITPLPALELKPNIVMIMADDLGYNDLSCYSHPYIETPVLDQLASEGVRLTSFYSGASVCTPSRMALLTGAYAWRTGWTQGVVGYRMAEGEGLSPDALTIAEVFRSSGYATGISGKWHVGDIEVCRPHRQGFESTYYIPRSNNQVNMLYRDDEIVERPFQNNRLTQQFTDEAIRFIEEHKDEPFFLYVPYTAPHFPVQAHPDWAGRSSFGAYGDVVEEMDFRIGEILETLKAKNIYENTIVIFMSDNGPQGGQDARADPFRGEKWSSLEGGNRVPCIISWPEQIPAGRVSGEVIGAIDLLPTLCRASGIDLNVIGRDQPKIDGIDVWPILSGESEDPLTREFLIWSGTGHFDAIRFGDWKFFINRSAALSSGSGFALFNLADDPAELTDLSEEHPDIINEIVSIGEPRFLDITSDVLPLADADYAVEMDWAGYPVDENGDTNTEGFLGWLHVYQDTGWLHSYSLNDFLFLPQSNVSETGAWVYVPR